MSNVVNLLFSCSIVDARYLERVNAFFGSAPGLRRIGPADVGGTKSFEGLLAIGAFDHLQVEALVDHIRQLPWKAPEDVQLFVKRQEEQRFGLIHACQTNLGDLVGEIFDGEVVKRGAELVFSPCGPYAYRPVPVGGFGNLAWKDRRRIRVLAVDHLRREMTVEVLA